MNELSNLMITSKRSFYTIHLELLTKEEYKLLLFLIESQERNYNKHTNNSKEFEALKEMLIENHNELNAS